MAIVEQRLSEEEIYIRFSNGGVFHKTRDQLVAVMALKGGKQKALLALRDELKEVVGTLLDLRELKIDFRNDGLPLLAEWEQS